MGSCLGRPADSARASKEWHSAGVLHQHQPSSAMGQKHSRGARQEYDGTFNPQAGGRALAPIEDDNDRQTQDLAGAEPAFESQPSLPDGIMNWKCGNLIGAGAFGRVFLGMNNDNGKLMAVKQVLISKDADVAGRVAENVRGLELEVSVLRELKHPNIVQYLGTTRTEEHLNIFLEYVPGGSIASLINSFGPFEETVIKKYTRQILLGLDYLHKKKVMHRDIKGANILVNDHGLVKLADFGASKTIESLVTMDSGCKDIKGTPYWMAPEVIKQTGAGRQADIWSVACTVIEMATGKPPWSQFSSQVSALFHIAASKGPPPIPENVSPECQNFLLLCFNRSPRDRPNAARLLQHPFLANVKDPRVPPLAASVNGPLHCLQPQHGLYPATISEEESSSQTSARSPASQQQRPADHLAAGSNIMDLRPGRIGSPVPKVAGPLQSGSMTGLAWAREPVPTPGLIPALPHPTYNTLEADFNPIQEPTWRQSEALPHGIFSKSPGAYFRDPPPGAGSPSKTRTSYAAHAPLRSASFDENSMPYGKGSAASGLQARSDSTGLRDHDNDDTPLQGPEGDESSMIQFLQHKASKDVMRLSIPFRESVPFKERSLNPALSGQQGPQDLRSPGSVDSGKREAQWRREAVHELNDELQQMRISRRRAGF
ncbi:hypothetical protein WJX74_002024 [Apatococcus lobatus]|uniref:mitogen-activated protein kinase kinase kinase n=1 Tax=Apatococcus lobatus TaxID=904363 RepID=A0AAW1Q981_9CHLO